MTEPQIPDDLKELYAASLERRDRNIGSECIAEDFVLNVNARVNCTLIERIAKAEEERDALKDRFDDYLSRLWCALGRPLNGEYIEAVKALKADLVISRRTREYIHAEHLAANAEIEGLEATVARLTKPVITEYGHGFMRDENEPILSCKQGIGLIEKEIQSLIYHAVFPEADDAEFTRILTREQEALIAARKKQP